jgi:hypothetical protein
MREKTPPKLGARGMLMMTRRYQATARTSKGWDLRFVPPRSHKAVAVFARARKYSFATENTQI